MPETRLAVKTSWCPEVRLLSSDCVNVDKHRFLVGFFFLPPKYLQVRLLLSSDCANVDKHRFLVGFFVFFFFPQKNIYYVVGSQFHMYYVK
jgi:hypothetical protein